MDASSARRHCMFVWWGLRHGQLRRARSSTPQKITLTRTLTRLGLTMARQVFQWRRTYGRVVVQLVPHMVSLPRTTIRASSHVTGCRHRLSLLRTTPRELRMVRALLRQRISREVRSSTLLELDGCTWLPTFRTEVSPGHPWR